MWRAPGETVLKAEAEGRADHVQPYAPRPGGTRFYDPYDGLGNVIALTDSSGNVANTYAYEPYAKVTTSSGTTANPWRFGASYEAYSENTGSGLLKIGQRFYDPSVGRWTRADLVHPPPKVGRK